MKRLIISVVAIVAVVGQLFAQYVSEVLEYKPAPGQFINATAWGMPVTAETIEGSLSGHISLGAFGGYIVFKFASPVVNDQSNPYGVDFVIDGNPLENISSDIMDNNVTWAEPGVVCVMKDENGNGEADDTWYELAGSDYFFSTTIKNYEVTYYNPGGTTSADVFWTDNQGDSGYVYANVYHSQAYYPLSDNFSNIDPASYTLSGTKMQDFVDTDPSTGYIVYAGRPWGYVDNNLVNTYTGVPDNPYTDNVEEGSGGDAFDISWAIDANGNYVELDEIDFVKVYNGVLADADALGEVSTEIRGAFDVAPDASITGWDSTFITVNNLPIRINAGKTVDLEAIFTVMGRKKDVDFSWSADTAIVTIDDNNQMTTIGTGTVVLTATCVYNGTTYSNSMKTIIIAPDLIEIESMISEIRVNEKSLLEATVYAQDGEKVTDLDVVWEASNSNVSFKEEGDSVYLVGIATGTAEIYAYPSGYADIRDTLEVTVLEAADSVSVYLTIKTEDGTYLPKSKMAVSNFNLSEYVKNANHSYGLSDITHVTLAHTVASVFDNVSFESDLRFKDSNDNGLYIYKLPVQSGSSVTYYYGYGNNGTSDSQLDCWMAKIGDKTYYRDFEDVAIYEGDDISVYHIEDITDTWCLYSLTTSATTIEAGGTLTVTLTGDSLYLYSETTVMTENSRYVSDETVYVDGDSYTTTDDNGQAQLTFSNAGIYTVQVATEEIELTVTSASSIEEQELTGVTFYPNPADAVLVINTSVLSADAQVNIYNISGVKVYSANALNVQDEHSIDISNWNEGMYLIRLVSKEGILNQRVVVKH